MPYNTLSRYATIIRRLPSLSVVYHETEIVSVDPQTGDIILNTGGWLSVTTKRKINAAIDEFNLFPSHSVGVIQRKGQWYITVQRRAYSRDNNRFAMPWDGSPIRLNVNSGLFTLDQAKAA